MRRGIGLLGGLLLAMLCWAEPAAAQGLPQGSYLQSCTRVSLQGDNLVAVCRRADGGEQRTSLAGVHRCVGDIGNMNGTLTCDYGGGAGPPPPPYGAPRAYGEERRERCGELYREAERLRARLDREWNPLDRSRIEGRLREAHAEQERARCR
jgi:hypothetical protein